MSAITSETDLSPRREFAKETISLFVGTLLFTSSKKWAPDG